MSNGYTFSMILYLALLTVSLLYLKTELPFEKRETSEYFLTTAPINYGNIIYFSVKFLGHQCNNFVKYPFGRQEYSLPTKYN